MREVPFKAIGQAALANLESVLDSLTVKRERSGDSWLILNPTREDKHLGSFKVGPDGRWYENATGDKGGDLISLVAYCRGVDQVTAAKELQDRFGPFASSTPTPKPTPKPTKLPPYSKEWIYRDAQGEELMRIRRFDLYAGKKEFRPLRTVDGKRVWEFPTPRPLYNLDQLASAPDALVVVVEGEKPAFATQKLFPNMVAVTSAGGAMQAKETDWTPLRGRQVVIWPDNDLKPDKNGRLPGLVYAGDVYALLKDQGVEARVVDVPKSWPDKWDLADPPPPGIGPADLQDMISQAQPWASEAPKAPKVTKRHLQVATWADFRGKQVPPVEFLIKPILPRVSFGLVAGQPGHGKSTVILQEGVALATGLPFMGYPVEKICGVGLLLLEDGINTIHRRLQAIIYAYGPEFTEEHHRLLVANLRIIQRRKLDLLTLEQDDLDYAFKDMLGELAEAMQSTEAPPGMVGVDTLNQIHDGEENNATDLRPLVAAIQALGDSLNCSVWVVHHYKKVGLGRNAPTLPDRMMVDIIRGTGALIGAIRGTFQMAWISKGEADKAGLDDWSGPHHYAIVGLTKVNDGPSSQWELWKHGEGGIMVPVKNGDLIIARILGGDATQKLDQQDKVLVAIYRAAVEKRDFDRKEVAAAICGKATDPAGSLRAVISNLKRAKLLSKSDHLTPSGFAKAQGLAQGTASDDEPEGGEAT